MQVGAILYLEITGDGMLLRVYTHSQRVRVVSLAYTPNKCMVAHQVLQQLVWWFIYTVVGTIAYIPVTCEMRIGGSITEEFPLLHK